MHTIETQEEIKEFERQRALVGTYIDHSYSREKLDWILEARVGFDEHVADTFHLLIPHNSNGYTVDGTNEYHYGVALARAVIKHLEVKHEDLPCIVFRAKDDDYYFLKLGQLSKDAVLKILGRIGDLAVETAKEGPDDPDEFRDWINMQTANFLRRQKMLSALKSALPALNGLLGGLVDAKELV